MEQQLEQIREQQKASWNKFSAGWGKWDWLLMDFMRPMGDAIIQSLQPNSTDIVLDIAAGTGEPGLTIATMLDGGKVVITDLAGDMLQIARDNATARGIANIETVACDVSALPFPDATFDAISCRFGFMFFPDMLLAAKEMVRVLKPGGKIAAAVWNVPEKNFWVTATMGIINKNIELPAPVPGAPGMFRCSEDGFMADLFAQVGLKNITEQEVTGTLKSKTVDNYWNMTCEVGAPIVAALSKTDDATRAKIKQEVFDLINATYPDGEVLIGSSAWVVCGESPPASVS